MGELAPSGVASKARGARIGQRHQTAEEANS